jgi:hypothetical protein
VILGFAPLVSSTLSTGGRALTRFRYSTFGCGGFGGDVEPGVDDYLTPYAVKSVGKVSLSSDGRFAVSNVRSIYKTRGQTTVTITSISGKFTSRAKASGTITFSQTFNAPGHTVPVCGPASVTFSVKRM